MMHIPINHNIFDGFFFHFQEWSHGSYSYTCTSQCVWWSLFHFQDWSHEAYSNKSQYIWWSFFSSRSRVVGHIPMHHNRPGGKFSFCVGEVTFVNPTNCNLSQYIWGEIFHFHGWSHINRRDRGKSCIDF